MGLFCGCKRGAIVPGVGWAVMGTVLAAAGCASPGPPRAPSLKLPEPVKDLVARRNGDTVELRFTAPSRTTDKLGIRGGQVTGDLCRQEGQQQCRVVPGSKATVATLEPGGARSTVTWKDALPALLTSGDPRLLQYRVEFFSPSGHTAGWSNAAATAAGTAPAPVEDLRATGSRLGVVLAWKEPQAAGEVLIRREDLSPKEAESKGAATNDEAKTAKRAQQMSGSFGSQQSAQTPIVWLGTAPKDVQKDGTPGTVLDTTAIPDTPYAYSAVRQVKVELGGEEVSLRSVPTPRVEFTLHRVYAPPVPSGLTAVGYAQEPPAEATDGKSFAVDLVWNPVDEAGLITAFAGYNVYRQTMQQGVASGRVRLNSVLDPSPAFHDTTARQGMEYLYSVTSVDVKGNESAAATVSLKPGTE